MGSANYRDSQDPENGGDGYSAVLAAWGMR
jgi:hypothetical protein